MLPSYSCVLHTTVKNLNSNNQKTTPKRRNQMNVYEVITERILQKLEQGIIPWKKPWNAQTGFPRNLVTNKEYRGVNVFLLACQGYKSPYWLTFRQAQEKGGTIRKGEKSTPIVFWSFIEKENPENGKLEETAILRYYSVFNSAQVDGIQVPPQLASIEHEFSAVEAAQAIINNMPNKPEIRYGMKQACYFPALDEINMPSPEKFETSEEFYSTLFHELTHATGHESRLNRRNNKERRKFGDKQYSIEELIAEMGASFLSAISEIDHVTIDNSTAYIQGWLKALRNDTRMVIMAAAQAQKAADFILNLDFKGVKEAA
jgi:antirestriction protein ArdC